MLTIKLLNVSVLLNGIGSFRLLIIDFIEDYLSQYSGCFSGGQDVRLVFQYERSFI